MSDRFCPVTDLPDCGVDRRDASAMKSPAGSALEAMGDLRDGHTRWMLDKDVNVVGCVADGEQRAMDASRFALQQSSEWRVMPRFEPRASVAGRPDHVHEQPGAGVCVPRDQRSDRIHRCVVDAGIERVAYKRLPIRRRQRCKSAPDSEPARRAGFSRIIRSALHECSSFRPRLLSRG